MTGIRKRTNKVARLEKKKRSSRNRNVNKSRCENFDEFYSGKSPACQIYEYSVCKYSSSEMWPDKSRFRSKKTKIIERNRNRDLKQLF